MAKRMEPQPEWWESASCDEVFERIGTGQFLAAHRIAAARRR